MEREHKADNDTREGEALAVEEERLKRARAEDLEFAKFKAQSWDRLSTQLVTVSLFTPVVGILYKVAPTAMLSELQIAFAMIAGLGGAVTLHLFGQAALKKGYEQ